MCRLGAYVRRGSCCRTGTGRCAEAVNPFRERVKRCRLFQLRTAHGLTLESPTETDGFLLYRETQERHKPEAKWGTQLAAGGENP